MAAHGATTADRIDLLRYYNAHARGLSLQASPSYRAETLCFRCRARVGGRPAYVAAENTRVRSTASSTDWIR